MYQNTRQADNHIFNVVTQFILFNQRLDEQYSNTIQIGGK